VFSKVGDSSGSHASELGGIQTCVEDAKEEDAEASGENAMAEEEHGRIGRYSEGVTSPVDHKPIGEVYEAEGFPRHRCRQRVNNQTKRVYFNDYVSNPTFFKMVTQGRVCQDTTKSQKKNILPLISHV
jgi:hypothetical protein